jgi:hypothetical protein
LLTLTLTTTTAVSRQLGFAVKSRRRRYRMSPTARIRARRCLYFGQRRAVAEPNEFLETLAERGGWGNVSSSVSSSSSAAAAGDVVKVVFIKGLGKITVRKLKRELPVLGDDDEGVGDDANSVTTAHEGCDMADV